MSQPSTLSLQEMLNDLIGVPYIRQGTVLDAIDGHVPSLVVEPGTEQELSAVLGWCNERGLAVSPRGGGTKLSWGNSPRAVDVVLSLERLDALVEHAHGDMTATVQAGMTLAEFQSALADHGQMLALDVENPEHATIGGLIATNDSGALRVRYGGIRDQIIGITVVRADGVVAHGGGRVVKNVAGYDLAKLYTGSLGSLGVITQATFRVYPLPAETRELRVEVGLLSEAGRLLQDVLGSTLMPTGLFVEYSTPGAVQVTVRFSGIRESVDAQMKSTEALFNGAITPDGPPRPLGEGGGGAPVSGLTDSPTPSFRGSKGATGAIALKISVLATEIAAAIERAVEIGAQNNWSTSARVHAHGLGRINWDTEGQEAGIAKAVDSLRAALAPRDGTVVVLEAPLQVKTELDVWGPAGDTVPLMRRVKAELDPRSTLNPGRLIGGI